MIFADRKHAGTVLARKLERYARRDDVLVFALPRGGVPVAYEIAETLRIPLDVLIVCKLGHPLEPEFALGAVASGGVRVMTDAARFVDREVIEKVAAKEEHELARREHLYRDERPLPDVQGRIVILVDDGLATGATIRAAVLALRQRAPAKIIVAVPIAAAETCKEFSDLVDEIICAQTPEPFYAVGAWYRDFSQTTDDEVRTLLKMRRH